MRLTSLAPLTNRVRGRLFGRGSIEELAVETIELAPAVQTEALRVIALPDEFDRVIEVEEHTDFATQRQWISGRPNPHAATVTRRFRDALLIDGAVYVGGQYQICKAQQLRLPVWREAETLPSAELCTNIASTTVFAHWVRDGLALELLAAERDLIPATLGQTWPHEPGYRALSGLMGRHIDAALVRDLWITDDRGLNAYWGRRFRQLRDRIRTSAANGGTPRYVFISRGRQGTARELVNALQIRDFLADLGFAILEPETSDPRDIARTLVNARIVISVEGSALNHAQLALPAGSAILAIQPPRRFNAFHRHFTDISSIRFAYVVADPVEGGFSLERDRLMRTIDLVERELG